MGKERWGGHKQEVSDDGDLREERWCWRWSSVNLLLGQLKMKEVYRFYTV